MTTGMACTCLQAQAPPSLEHGERALTWSLCFTDFGSGQVVSAFQAGPPTHDMSVDGHGWLGEQTHR